jgi:hypothetical protein
LLLSLFGSFFLLLFRLFKTKRRLLDTLTYYKRY